MTCASTTSPAAARPLGEADLVADTTIDAALGVAEREGFLGVTVPAPGPARRGRLALAIEEAVEDTLARRGAAPSGVGAASLLDATLGDQLYRARLIGAAGIAIALPALDGIANLAGALDAEDSAVLRWWIAATRERPVRLFFAERDRQLGVYGPPVPLASLLEEPAPAPARDAGTPAEPAPAPAPEVAASVAAMELTEQPPAVAPGPTHPAGTASASPSETRTGAAAPIAPLELELELDAPSSPPKGAGPALPPTRHIPRPPRRRAPDPAEPRYGVEPGSAPPDPTSAAPSATKPEPLLGQHAAPLPPRASSGATPGTENEVTVPRSATPSPPEPGDLGGAGAGSARERPRREASEPPAPLPLVPDAASRWPAWVEELDATRGPKPLAAVERMFVSTYLPLRDARAHGLADARSQEIADAWAASFAKSYSEAFDALRARGKRPSMVLDVPELAQRLARLHGARATQLILVDGMRFDLGLRMHGRLQERLERRAALAERLLLWSALPTTTATQLDLIARGPEGLKDVHRVPETTLPVARGRAAATPRRIKAGHRDLLKLDLIATRLAERNPLSAVELDDLATAAAGALSDCLGRLAPRTLAFVFGDHGFRIGEDGTPSEGGASPEEVLVPAFAWVVGEMH